MTPKGGLMLGLVTAPNTTLMVLLKRTIVFVGCFDGIVYLTLKFSKPFDNPVNIRYPSLFVFATLNWVLIK